MILGIDEVGRGPWAGPLVVGAVILGDASIPGLTDSKKLSKKMRSKLDILIREQAVAYGLGWVDAKEIDSIGLSQALMLATHRALADIKEPYDKIVIDGTINLLRNHAKSELVETMIKADLYDMNVSAASIIAKVARDTYMDLQTMSDMVQLLTLLLYEKMESLLFIVCHLRHLRSIKLKCFKRFAYGRAVFID